MQSMILVPLSGFKLPLVELAPKSSQSLCLLFVPRSLRSHLSAAATTEAPGTTCSTRNLEHDRSLSLNLEQE